MRVCLCARVWWSSLLLQLDYMYRRVPSERPPSFIRPPPPLFFHIERIGIVNAPPLVYPPPPPFPSVLFLVISHLTSVLLPVISHPTLPPCIMKFQNVRDISRGTWPTIVLAFTCDAHGMIVVVVLSA